MTVAKFLGYDHNKAAIDKAAKRFWARVQVGEGDQCWIWAGTVMTSGYGELSFLGRKIGAHRFSYLLHGNDLEAGECVLHENFCNDRLCVNPSHLYQGSYKDNWEDMVRRAEAARVPGGPLSEDFWDFLGG